jgi:hypothetical protein
MMYNKYDKYEVSWNFDGYDCNDCINTLLTLNLEHIIKMLYIYGGGKFVNEGNVNWQKHFWTFKILKDFWSIVGQVTPCKIIEVW